MFDLIYNLYFILDRGLEIYTYVLLVYFLLSWFPAAYGTTLWNLLARASEPFLSFFRRFVPPIGNVSFAGVVAVFAIGLIRRGLQTIFIFLLNSIM